MPRRAAIEPNESIHTTLPPRLWARVKLLLWSEAEGAIPRGALQKFLVQVITEYFHHRKVDVGVFMDRQPGEVMVSGDDHALSTLINHLKGGKS